MGTRRRLSGDVGSLAAGVLSALILTAGFGGDLKAEELRLTLASALDMAVGSSHLLRSADLEVEKAGISIKRARAERYVPEAELLVETGVVPAARGTALDSPDQQSDLDSLGPFYKINLKIVQPLYTFGRLKNLEKLAREGLGAAEANAELALQELSLLVIETYWSLMSSREAVAIAEELRDNFRKLLVEVEKRIDDEDSEVDDTDLLEVKSSTYPIEKVFLDSREDSRKSLMVMRILVGAGAGEDLVTGGESSPEFEVGMEVFDRFLLEKGVMDKQLDVLAAAARALERKIELTKSERYPLIFLAAAAGFAEAPNRDDQTNPFVLDDFNYARIGAGIGISWRPNLYKSGLEVDEMRKEHQALLEKIEALRRKLTVEASVRFGEAAKNRALLDAARESLAASKSWLRLSLDNFDLGIGEVKRLLDAYEAYFEMKGVEVAMELEYNVSLARVASSLGDVGRYLKWLEKGEVEF
jgi:outer membrane protein TolC